MQATPDRADDGRRASPKETITVSYRIDTITDESTGPVIATAWPQQPTDPVYPAGGS